jgi:hypothetical protein
VCREQSRVRGYHCDCRALEQAGLASKGIKNLLLRPLLCQCENYY